MMACFYMAWTGDDGSYQETSHILGRPAGEKRTFVGDSTNPIWFGTRKEKSELLLNTDFNYIYEVWRNMHLWSQWPDGKPWGEQDAEVVDIVNSAEQMYQHRFSADFQTLKNTAEISAYTKVTAQGKRMK